MIRAMDDVFVNGSGKAEETGKGSGKTPRAPQRRARTQQLRERYINREISWLAFNFRVLEEANNPNHPLLERLRFLSISASNLDEFYMVRVAGLKGQVRAGVGTPSEDGQTPAEQLHAIHQDVGRLMQAQHSCWSNLVQELRGEGIAVVRPDELTQREKTWLRKYVDGIMPVLTPLAIDPAHPFPFMPNMGFSLVLSLTQPGMEEPLRALLPVPNQLDRFIRLPGDATRFIPLEDVIALFLLKSLVIKGVSPDAGRVSLTLDTRFPHRDDGIEIGTPDDEVLACSHVRR